MLYKDLKADRKKLIFAFFAVIVIHMYKFVNYLPTWDSVGAINYRWTGLANHGRWFSGVFTNLLTSPYDLPWVEGLVSAVFLALSAVLLIRIFKAENKPLSYLSIILFVCLPSVASTFAYMHLSACYTGALFFAIVATYLCISAEKKYYVPIAALLLALSIGTYQIYFPLAVLLFIYYIATELLNENKKLRDYKKSILMFVIACVAGAIVYFVINKIFMGAFNIESSSYQGGTEIKIQTVSQYLIAAKVSIASFLRFFFVGKKITLYGIINVLIIILTLILVFKCIILNKKLSVKRRILICILFLTVIPLTYSFYFLSDEVFYHSLMETGNYFVYLLIPVLVSRFETNIKSFFKNTACVLLAVLCFYNFVNANIAYQKMSMSYEKTTYAMSETAAKIDALTDKEHKTVTVIGSYPKGDETIECIPSIMGASTNNFIWIEPHFGLFAKHYLGRDYEFASNQKKKEITETQEFEEMDSYPNGEYVKIIDDIIVVKLSEN